MLAVAVQLLAAAPEPEASAGSESAPSAQMTETIDLVLMVQPLSRR
jgi:hypothetical protein